MYWRSLRFKNEIWKKKLKYGNQTLETVTIASIAAYSKNEACLGFKTLSLSALISSPYKFAAKLSCAR